MKRGFFIRRRTSRLQSPRAGTGFESLRSIRSAAPARPARRAPGAVRSTDSAQPATTNLQPRIGKSLPGQVSRHTWLDSLVRGVPHMKPAPAADAETVLGDSGQVLASSSARARRARLNSPTRQMQTICVRIIAMHCPQGAGDASIAHGNLAVFPVEGSVPHHKRSRDHAAFGALR